MNIAVRRTFWIGTIALSALAAIVTLATLAGTQLPLIDGARAAVLALAVIGVVMCIAYGMQWNRNPINIIGMVLGVLALVLAGAVLFSIQLPLIADDRTALIVLGVIVAVKVLLAVVRQFTAFADR